MSRISFWHWNRVSSRRKVAGPCFIGVSLVLAVDSLCGLNSRAAEVLDEQKLDAGNPPVFFRFAENDGVNCLYLQLRLLGYDRSYEAFRAQLPQDSKSLT